ncbi:TAF8 [Acrasis kona]|uniref:Transcription initiation factor TFIID subunit 8 n=1 Tax=Acrasis kona TaxID=1008807 RepID=A0AAW2Z4I0_9EUKA
MTEQFTHELCKKVIADICGTLGFHAIKNSSAEVLADIFRSYVIQIGESCVQMSQHSGRTEQNANDVEYALKKDLNLDIKDLYQYYITLGGDDDAESILHPVNLSNFEFDVPSVPRPKASNFLLAADQTIATRFARIDAPLQADGPPPPNNYAALTKQKHNELEAYRPPPFLPPFPPQHTFSFTSVHVDRNKDAYTLQQIKTKQRRQVESSLTRIHNSELMDQVPQGMSFEEEWEFHHEQNNNMTIVDHNTPEHLIKNNVVDEDLVVNPYLMVMRRKVNVEHHSAPKPVYVVPLTPSAPLDSQPPPFVGLSLKRPLVTNKDIGTNDVRGDKEVITGVTGQDINDLMNGGNANGEPNRKKPKKALV